ncbi:ligand-binding SRPBCC domain-containing protein [Salsuginibacillus halophilus]|uniref:Ligand-binding SRPBCC domain-containing protein n=1 Tax=Salsuginibacillus halophilus TaxID=517424 RepID=A0A2P8HX45_9BACI|nr:hypothetical protein [Salsuginibacillus halophilus]PSL50811.1 ligand-binding SRPBCC domain-containing protein [Salsuginibacillus halophilus]
MGRLAYTTKIQAPVNEVWAYFQNPKNLESLTTFPKVHVKNDAKDIYHVPLVIRVGPLKFHWESRISEIEEGNYFVDEGEVLPFPFQAWQHTHMFVPTRSGTNMIDKVQFEAAVPDLCVKAGLYQMFKSREAAVKEMFEIRQARPF